MPEIHVLLTLLFILLGGVIVGWAISYFGAKAGADPVIVQIGWAVVGLVVVFMMLRTLGVV